MDNVTHALLGYAVYAATKSSEQHKRWYAAAAILGAEIPDIEAFTTFFGNDVYLYWHRNITHSILFTPVMALFAILILRLFSRQRPLKWKSMYVLALGGVTTHWLFDFFNTWGTGLLEPFTNERYSLGILPIIDIVLFIIFAFGFYLRKRIGSFRAFRWVWGLIFVYVSVQALQNMWIYEHVKGKYDQHVVAADFLPGQFTVIGKTGSRVEIFSRNLFIKGRKTVLERFIKGRKTVLESNEEPNLTKKVLENPEAKAIAWFSPFVVIKVKENQAVLFDPRFYRNGSSFLKAEVSLNETK